MTRVIANCENAMIKASTGFPEITAALRRMFPAADGSPRDLAPDQIATWLEAAGTHLRWESVADWEDFSCGGYLPSVEEFIALLLGCGSLDETLLPGERLLIVTGEHAGGRQGIEVRAGELLPCIAERYPGPWSATAAAVAPGDLIVIAADSGWLVLLHHGGVVARCSGVGELSKTRH